MKKAVPNNVIEALEKQLKQPVPLEEHIQLLNQLAWHYRYFDVGRMRDLANQAIALSHTAAYEDAPFQLGVFSGYKNLATAQMYEGDYEGALPLFLDALNTLETLDVPSEILQTLGGIGRCYSGLSNYPQAVHYHLQQLQLSQEENNAEEIFSAYVGLGIAYFELNQIEEAIAYEEKALKIAETLADKVHLLTILNNLATNHNYLGNYEHSIRLSKRALTILETYPVEITYFHVISTLVEAYLGTGQYALAQELLQDSFNQLKDRPFKELQQHVLILLGKLYLAQEEPAAAISHLQQAAEMADHIGNKHIAADVHLTLSEAYQKAEQWPQALHHYQQFHLNRELMFNAQADQRLKSIEVTYDTAAARQEAAFLQSQNEALEQTVNERTQELQSALDRERLLKQELAHALTQEAELSSLKSQIITTVSHEFRTPLTVINTSTNLLYKRFERLSEEKRQELFERVHQSIFYLSDLLQDISLVNIMQNEQVTPSYNDYTFSSLCQHLSSQLAYELGHPPNLVFSYDENLNALIELDFELLKQIVFDLLSNAIKYSEPTEPIAIEFKIDEQCFKISVQDQGIGIPKEELQKIFELFYRGTNVSTRRGMGLGLYIVKHLTDSLQGQVYVVSAGDGQGSRFTVQIPLKAQTNA